MNESNEQNERERMPEIHIARLNNDKTRRVDGSETVYNVYFELSATPPQSWETLFEGEWKLINVAHPDLWQAAHVDRNFLVLRSALDQVVPMHLPFLKQAVAATNVRYAQYEGIVAQERAERQMTWERERSDVEAMAKTVTL